MSRLLGWLALACLPSAASAQSIVVSGFADSHSSGWVERMSAFNGTWQANEIKPIQLCPNSQGNPVGARVGVSLRHGQVVVTLERAAWNPRSGAFPATIGYTPVAVFGLPTGAATGVIRPGGFDASDTRRIAVQ